MRVGVGHGVRESELKLGAAQVRLAVVLDEGVDAGEHEVVSQVVLHGPALHGGADPAVLDPAGPPVGRGTATSVSRPALWPSCTLGVRQHKRGPHRLPSALRIDPRLPEQSSSTSAPFTYITPTLEQEDLRSNLTLPRDLSSLSLCIIILVVTQNLPHRVVLRIRWDPTQSVPGMLPDTW